MNIAWIQEIFQPVHEILVPRTLVKSAYQKNNYRISQPKHMLWVLKRTYVKMDGQENINNFTLKKMVYLNLWVPMELAGSGISDNPVYLQVSPAHAMKAWVKILASSSTR